MQKHFEFESNDLYTVTRDGEYYVLTYYNGDKYYWIDGSCQRNNGPCCILHDGTKWWSWRGYHSYNARTWDEFIIQLIIE